MVVKGFMWKVNGDLYFGGDVIVEADDPWSMKCWVIVLDKKESWHRTVARKPLLLCEVL